MKSDDNNKKKFLYKKNKDQVKIESSSLNDNEGSSKATFNLVEVIIIMIVTILFGLLIGSFISYSRFNNDREVSCSMIRNDMIEFSSIYDDLLNDYYGDIDKEGLLESAIKGMVDYLDDPYSAYIDKTEALEFNEELEGAFLGIGIEVKSVENELPVVNKVYDNSPAMKAGVEVGDVVFKINNSVLEELSVSEVSNIIKESSLGSEIKLSVLRDGIEIDFVLTVSSIELESVFGFIENRENKNIGVIKISTFAKNSYEQFDKVYKRLEKQNIDYLIIDVRGNTGGYLSVAKDIASLFLDKGTIVYQRVSDNNVEKVISEKDKKIEVPVLFIIDGNTASAAEVLVSALKENIDSVILGVKSYGKGTIQKLHPLSNGSYVKYTSQIWRSSNGVEIEGVGINPDYVVEQDLLYYEEPSVQNDRQLQEAYNVLIEKEYVYEK